MHIVKKISALALLGLTLVITGCANQQPGYDYTAFRESNPASIVVLPPVNKSPDIKASYSLYSQVSVPLGEAGYYVLPVALVDETFKQNGLMNPDEMHAAPPAKLREIFGADTALYIEITEYGSSYMVISSEVVVTANAKLVDLRSGQLLWEGSASASTAEQNNNNQGGLVGMLIIAAVNQIVNTITDRGHEIAGLTSARLLTSQRANGILPGPRARPVTAQ